jgi:hypothetical protein
MDNVLSWDRGSILFQILPNPPFSKEGVKEEYPPKLPPLKKGSPLRPPPLKKGDRGGF